MLVKNEQSVAAVCRTLSINRTQFNRFLAGESFPAPDVLTRICQYFGVSVRIINEPLSDTREPSLLGFQKDFDPSPILNKIWIDDGQQLPDGLYGFYLGHFADRAKYSRQLVRIYTLTNGFKVFKGVVSEGFAKSSGQSTLWRDRVYPGIFFKHVNTFSLILSSNYAALTVYGCFDYGLHSLPSYFPGFFAVTQQARPNERQIVPGLLEHLRGGMEEYRYHRRRVGNVSLEDLDPIQRDYFENWTPPS
ncbi:hypothetical protein [Celeribacter arenosi]|uniref:HTH cro/C1-type domain-containing protein n=1 Tax=Celeribacter arenosi TaxID=792649 RepID=A0ABP7KDL2_9RHOB